MGCVFLHSRFSARLYMGSCVNLFCLYGVYIIYKEVVRARPLYNYLWKDFSYASSTAA